jgi:hypothetical protein
MRCRLAIVSLFFILTSLGVSALPLQARETRPRKLFNLKGGAGYFGLPSASPEDFCQPIHRSIGQFGLQTAIFPFTAEVNFYTHIAFEAYAGAFWPVTRVGWGWLAFHSGLFWRGTYTKRPRGSSTCADKIDSRFLDTFGVGLTSEYLLYDGNLGFYVEVRQGFIPPAQTMVTAGITFSPLLWLYFRNN